MTDANPPLANANTSLNVLSTVLVAAVTATTGVLTAFGLNDDRVWVLLDDDANRLWLLLAGGGSILAVGCALGSYLVDSRIGRTVLLFVGTFLYLAGLGAAILGAAQSADTQGRPSIVNMAINKNANGPVVAFKVAGASMDNTERLGVRLYDEPTGTVLVEAYPRPTAGVVQFEASLPVGSGNGELVLKVWTIDEWGQEPRCPEDSDDSNNSTLVYADCVTLRLPAGALPE